MMSLRICFVNTLQELVPSASAQPTLAPEPFLFRYQFREPLIEGVILRKRKRFTADVAVDGQVVVCHCPTTCLSLYQTLLDGQQVTHSCWLLLQYNTPTDCLLLKHRVQLGLNHGPIVWVQRYNLQEGSFLYIDAIACSGL